MSTYKEIAYMISDELKLSSDDSIYTIDHILFLMDKYRATMLKKEYLNLNKVIPQQNVQIICLPLEKTNFGLACSGNFGVYLKSTSALPKVVLPASIEVYPADWMRKEQFIHVSRERMQYVGVNKRYYNFIYNSIGPDFHLYLRSNNPQFLHLDTIKVGGVFEDTRTVGNMECDNSTCDVMDREYPLESALVPVLISYIVKEIGDVLYNPSDENNDANDQLDEVKVTKQTNETK